MSMDVAGCGPFCSLRLLVGRWWPLCMRSSWRAAHASQSTRWPVLSLSSSTHPSARAVVPSASDPTAASNHRPQWRAALPCYPRDLSPAMEAEQKGRWAGAGGPPVGGTTGRRQGGAIGPSSFLSWSIRGGEGDRQSGSLPHLFLCTSDGWIKFRTSTTMWGPNFRRPRRRCGRSRPTRARSGRPWQSSRRPARTSTMPSAPPLPRSSSALGGLDGDTQLQAWSFGMDGIGNRLSKCTRHDVYGSLKINPKRLLQVDLIPWRWELLFSLSLAPCVSPVAGSARPILTF